MLKRNNSTAVLILNFNGQRFLSKCYDSLMKQTDSTIDIWLIDNNSSDDSVEYTRKYFPSIRIFNTNGNHGYAGSYNLTHAYFKKMKLLYQYYLFINNDTQADRKMIEKLHHGFLSDKSIGALSPTILDNRKHISMMNGRFLFLTGTTLGTPSQKKFRRSNHLFECFWVSGCCLMTSVRLFDQLDGFADYFIYYEDLDYSWRVNNVGYKVCVLNNCYVIHTQGGAGTATEFQIYLNERNRIISYYRNLPIILFILYSPFLLFLRLILLHHFAPTFTIRIAKLKAIKDAFVQLANHKRYPVKWTKHLSVIYSMNRVIKRNIV